MSNLDKEKDTSQLESTKETTPEVVEETQVVEETPAVDETLAKDDAGKDDGAAKEKIPVDTISKEPVAEESKADEPAAEEPKTDEPAADEPIADTPQPPLQPETESLEKATVSHDKSESTGGQSNAGDFATDLSAEAAAGALEDISLADKAPSASRTSSKVPTASHPLQDDGPSPADIAAAILNKSAASHTYASRSTHYSSETERTAFSSPPRNSASPPLPPRKSLSPPLPPRKSLSPRLPPRAGPSSSKQTEIIEADDSDDEADRREEQQRRLFKIAEQRRKERERMQHDKLSSGEIEMLRSGLANAHEQPRPITLRILNGSFPDGLRGSLYTLGPGRFDIKYNVQRELEQATQTFTFGNLMDALPLLGKFSFDDAEEKITYRSRLIAKQLAGRIQMEHGVSTRSPGALYQTDTNQTFLNMFIPKGSHYNTSEGECCNQDIQLFMPLQGSTQNIVTVNHMGAVQNLDPEDLRPRSVLELKDINPLFKAHLSSAHMQYDANTREYFTVTQDVGFRTTTYNVVAISEAHPEGYVVANFFAQASVMHSFSITQDYIIVPVYPYASPIGGNYRWGDSLLDSLSFAPSQPVQFYVISREYRRVQCVYEAPSFFALHQINAVQESATDSVMIDLIAYEDDTILRKLRIKELRHPSVGFFLPSGQVRRYQLNGITMEATKFVENRGRTSVVPPAHMTILRPEPIELARINPVFDQKPYSYVYALSHLERMQGLGAHMNTNTMYNCIVKIDANDPMVSPLVWHRKGCYPSEPVFVPKNETEDDGYLLSVFFDSMLIKSCLLVLDAKTLEELTIAELPSAVPISFGHAKFAI